MGANANGWHGAPIKALDEAKTLVPPKPAVQLTLLVRAYCHLCDDMRIALAPIAARANATLVEIDVDAEPALEAAYGERVPVLLLGDVAHGRELCHYTLDVARVMQALGVAR